VAALHGVGEGQDDDSNASAEHRCDGVHIDRESDQKPAEQREGGGFRHGDGSLVAFSSFFEIVAEPIGFEPVLDEPPDGLGSVEVVLVLVLFDLLGEVLRNLRRQRIHGVYDGIPGI